MINLDTRYHSYLHSEKRFEIDGIREKVTAYGYTDNGSDIDGYYVKTESHTLYFCLKGLFKHKELLVTE